MDVTGVGDDSDYRHTAYLFHHPPSALKQPHVATKFVDDNAFDASPVILGL